MRPIRDLDLMRLADGELDAEERAELEAALAADPERAQKVAAVEQLGEAVRGHLEMSADEAESRLDRMWDEVEKRIALDRPEVAAVPAVPVTEPARGLWGRFTGWLDTHRAHVLTGALSAGAVAALALIFRPTPEVVKVRETIAVPTPMPTQPDVQDVVPVVHQPAQVESMEVAGGTGTVFTIEDEDGEETTVIWVTPDDTVEGI
jgi:hypothetical protein